MIAASSSPLHFDCFFLAGDSDGCGPGGASLLLVGGGAFVLGELMLIDDIESLRWSGGAIGGRGP